MKRENIEKALSDISDSYIDEAAVYRRKKRHHAWAKITLPIAACAAFAVITLFPLRMVGCGSSQSCESAEDTSLNGSDSCIAENNEESKGDTVAPGTETDGDRLDFGSNGGAGFMDDQGDAPDEELDGTATPEPMDTDLVYLLDYIPTMYVDLKYATEDNFTGQIIYDFTEPQLRYGTVKKLAEVQEKLLAQGYSLKLWDGYRPTEAQFKLWEICPDGNFVANPEKGFSSHSRGNTVDVTLTLADGTPIPMPTGFDDFTSLADREYSDVTGEALENVMLLESCMEEQGFRGYSREWWHFSDSTEYPVVGQE